MSMQDRMPVARPVRFGRAGGLQVGYGLPDGSASRERRASRWRLGGLSGRRECQNKTRRARTKLGGEYLCELLSLGKLCIHLLGVVLLGLERSVRHFYKSGSSGACSKSMLKWWWWDGWSLFWG